jgi:hypothetical protein
MKKNEFINHLRASVINISEVVSGKLPLLTSEQLNWKAGKSWSLLECIEHLNRYNNFYLAAIASAIKNARNSDIAEITSTWIGRKSINMMHPSNIKKQTTFKKMDPSNSNLDRSVLETFLNDQRKLLLLLSQAHAVDINAKKVPVEFFRLLKMTIAEGLAFVVVHEQRHVNQIQRLLLNISERKDPALSI